MKRLVLFLLSFSASTSVFATEWNWSDIQKGTSYRIVVACTDIVAVTSEILSTTTPIRSKILPIPQDTKSIGLVIRSGTSVIGSATSFSGTISSVTIAVGLFPSRSMAEQYQTINSSKCVVAPQPYMIPVSDSGLTYLDIVGGTFTKYGTYDLPVNGNLVNSLVIMASPTATATAASMRQLGNEGLTFEIYIGRK